MNHNISVDLIQNLMNKKCHSVKSKRESEIVNKMNSYSDLLSEEFLSNKLIQPVNLTYFKNLKFENKKKIICLSNELKNIDNENNLSFKKRLKDHYDFISKLESITDEEIIALNNKRDSEKVKKKINFILNQNISPLSEKLKIKYKKLKELKFQSMTWEMRDNTNYKLSNSPVSIQQSFEEEEDPHYDDEYDEEGILDDDDNDGDAFYESDVEFDDQDNF